MAFRLAPFLTVFVTAVASDDGYSTGPQYGASNSAVPQYGGAAQSAPSASSQKVPQPLQPRPQPPSANRNQPQNREVVFGAGEQQPQQPFNPKKLVGPIIGGVAGAAALAGVIAVSAMKKPGIPQPSVAQNTTLPTQAAVGIPQSPGVQNYTLPSQAAAQNAASPAQAVQGSMALQVHDATFAKDETALKAVAAGLADVAGVPKDYVVLTVSTIQATKHTEVAHVSYRIVVPAADKMHHAEEVVKELASSSAADISKAIRARVVAAKGSGYPVTVTKNFVGSAPIVVMQAPLQRGPPAVTTPQSVVSQAEETVKPPLTNHTAPSMPPSSNEAVTMQTKLESSHGEAAASELKQGSGLFQELPVLHGAHISTTSTTSTSRLIVVDGGSSISGSSSSSGFNNGFMVGGIAIAWAVIAFCVVGIFFLKKKYNKAKKKPTKETHVPNFSEYERLRMNSDCDQEAFMKGTSREVPDASRDMESQYMPVNPTPASQYTGQQYSARHADPAVPAFAARENPPPPPAPMSTSQNTQAPPPYVPQPSFQNSYMPHVSPLAQTTPSMLPATTMSNGLIGIGLPPIQYR